MSAGGAHPDFMGQVPHSWGCFRGATRHGHTEGERFGLAFPKSVAAKCHQTARPCLQVEGSTDVFMLTVPFQLDFTPRVT